MPIDPATLLAKGIERAAEKCGQLPGMAAAQVLGDDALAEILSTHLLAFLGLNGNAGTAPNQADVNDQGEHATPQRLLERHRSIARAVGACECWGDLSGCEKCGGFGQPGWALPEKRQFDALVRPALRTIRQYRFSKRNGGDMSLRVKGERHERATMDTGIRGI
jgi:hypothetical protein